VKRALVCLAIQGLVACGANRVTPAPTPSADAATSAAPVGDASASASDATAGFASVEHLRAALASDAVQTSEQHVLEGAGNGVEWTTTNASPVCLRLAAAGPYAVLVDGKRQVDGIAPADGSLVPAAGPLCVPAGELRVVGASAGRIVVAFGTRK
jgi:hypothetical protein